MQVWSFNYIGIGSYLLTFSYELPKGEWCSLGEHMPMASPLTQLNEKRTYGPSSPQCPGALAKEIHEQRELECCIIQKKQRRSYIGQRLCTGNKKSMSCTPDSILNLSELGVAQHLVQAI